MRRSYEFNLFRYKYLKKQRDAARGKAEGSATRSSQAAGPSGCWEIQCIWSFSAAVSLAALRLT